MFMKAGNVFRTRDVFGGLYEFFINVFETLVGILPLKSDTNAYRG